MDFPQNIDTPDTICTRTNTQAIMNLTNPDRDVSCRGLDLHPLNRSDTEAMFDIPADPQSMKYLSNVPLAYIKDAEKLLSEDLGSDAKGSAMCRAITLKGQNRLIGKCILFQFSWNNRHAEIGFMINRDYWRQGLTSQAEKTILGFAFNTLKLHHIKADVDPCNTGSLTLLEKLNFWREALFRDRWYINGVWADSVMLGLLNQEGC